MCSRDTLDYRVDAGQQVLVRMYAGGYTGPRAADGSFGAEGGTSGAGTFGSAIFTPDP